MYDLQVCQKASYLYSTYTQYIQLCAVNDCGPLTDSDSGQIVSLNGTTFGSIATCSGSRTCGADGLWTALESNCQSKSENSSVEWCKYSILCYIDLLISSTDLPSIDSPACSISGIVIAVIWFVISMVIFALLVAYILHLRRQLNQQADKR